MRGVFVPTNPLLAYVLDFVFIFVKIEGGIITHEVVTGYQSLKHDLQWEELMG